MINIEGNIEEVYVGSTKIAQAYIGSQLVYESNPYDEYGYIKSDKIFHLDGLIKGSDNTKWVDLVGGISFTFTSHTIAESDGVRFDGAGLLVSAQTVTRTLYPNESTTVEIVYEPYTKSCWVFGLGSSACPSMVENTTNVGLNGKLGYAKTNIVTLSCNYNVGVGNGLVLESTGSAISFSRPYSANPPFWLGGRNYGAQYFYKGKIRCIRIYNRLLTSNEMIHNQQVDNQRFNLGLII